jgi:3-keto-5-aminohexanoate cleavage enzyme
MADRMSAVVIQCAVTGAQDADGRTPHLPKTPVEIAEAAIEAAGAGAAILHIHARTEDGVPTQSVRQFDQIVSRIRDANVDAILNLSTGSAGGRAAGAERYACLELEPEMASFDCGSLNFGDRIFENPTPFLREMAECFLERGVKPEIECFEAGHIALALRLRDEGLLEEPMHFQFVLGVPGGGPGTVEQAAFMRSQLPAGVTWSVCGVGRAQLPLNLYSLAAGGQARTGMEDSLRYTRAELARSNAQLVERLVRIAGELGLEVAGPEQAREALGLAGQSAPGEEAR